MTDIASLIANGPVILDGGWGTQLQLHGLEVGAHPDLWNLTAPEKVEQVARAYVEAGSQVILTNTFGATKFTLEKHGYGDKVADVNRAGVEISKRATTGTPTKVFASMGPTGVMLMMGEVKPEQLYDAFLEQAAAIATAGADAVVVETMSDPAEAELAVKAAKTTGLPVAVSFVFDSGKNHDRTMMGTTPEQVVQRMTDAGADIIGSNCGQGIDGFIPICRRMRAVTAVPIWMKANAGLPEIEDGKTVYRQTPVAFAEKSRELAEAGANFIGGCCGTSPDFIRALVAVTA
ncbi:MAG: homocysteine S-methyltransferase family protein [Planctomycetaceae bacterium]|nr:homocysteine S-methyltransferase family protein [Planctomycetaceae bacterium]